MSDEKYDKALAIFTEASNKEDEGDLKSAIHLYQQAIGMQFTPAYTNLGNIYDDKMLPSDPARAVELYEKAVALGDAVGAYCLAIHYRNLGDVEQEQHWRRRATDMGYSDT